MTNIQTTDTRALDFRAVEQASVTLELLLRGKWRLQMLLIMCSGPIRLGQLARLIPGASKKVLTQNLRKFEADGIIVRNDLSDTVLHVEYGLHPNLQASVITLLNELVVWGDLYARWSATDSGSNAPIRASRAYRGG